MLLIDRRRYMHASNDVIMTSATNPEVLAICYAKGWCATADKMTKDEAAAVTDAQFSSLPFTQSNIVHFDELQYFSALTAIPANAFIACSSLVSIVLPSGVTSIGAYAFMNCSVLTKFNIPSGVTTIGGRALQGCSLLATITSNATTAPSVQANTFTNTGSSASGKVLKVPSGASGYDSGDWLTLQTTYGYNLIYE